MDGLFDLVADCLRAEEPVAWATVIELAPREKRVAPRPSRLSGPRSSYARRRSREARWAIRASMSSSPTDRARGTSPRPQRGPPLPDRTSASASSRL